jgi:flagellar basal-body rod modification protein FlgD
MSVTSIAASNPTSGTAAVDSIPNANQTLNQNDFLQLLVTQMENQDPLNPQSDTEMASQMAQFTSLQQSSAMSGSLSMLQASSLIGSTVTVQVNSQTTANGVVQGVIMQNGSPQVVVNGADYALNQVVSVKPTASSSAAPVSPSTVSPVSPSTSTLQPAGN